MPTYIHEVGARSSCDRVLRDQHRLHRDVVRAQELRHPARTGIAEIVGHESQGPARADHHDRAHIGIRELLLPDGRLATRAHRHRESSVAAARVHRRRGRLLGVGHLGVPRHGIRHLLYRAVQGCDGRTRMDIRFPVGRSQTRGARSFSGSWSRGSSSSAR